MRKEECLRRKWKEEKEDSHLKICVFKCRENKKRFIYFLFILFPFSSGFNFYLFNFLFHQKEIFKWEFYLIKREQVLLIK